MGDNYPRKGRRSQVMGKRKKESFKKTGDPALYFPRSFSFAEKSEAPKIWSDFSFKAELSRPQLVVLERIASEKGLPEIAREMAELRWSLGGAAVV